MLRYTTRITNAKPYVVSFFGHDKACDRKYIRNQLQKLIHMLIIFNERTVFLIKPDMPFDELAHNAIRREHKILTQAYSEIILIPPYKKHTITPNTNFKLKPRNKRFCHKEYKVSLGLSADEVRCRSIVDRSDMVICYIDSADDIAYSAVLYAYTQKKKRELINLAEDEMY